MSRAYTLLTGYRKNRPPCISRKAWRGLKPACTGSAVPAARRRRARPDGECRSAAGRAPRSPKPRPAPAGGCGLAAAPFAPGIRRSPPRCGSGDHPRSLVGHAPQSGVHQPGHGPLYARHQLVGMRRVPIRRAEPSTLTGTLAQRQLVGRHREHQAWQVRATVAGDDRGPNPRPRRGRRRRLFAPSESSAMARSTPAVAHLVGHRG